MGTLADIYTKHGTDKGETEHCYGNFYEPYFSRYVGSKATILELGVWTGDSLSAHDEYFRDADIWGVDIDLQRCKDFGDKSNVHLVQRNTNDVAYFMDIFKGIKFDIILDDASHTCVDQMNNLYNFRQFLKSDGIYVLEDLHCSWDKNFGCTYEDSPTRFLLEQHKVSYLDGFKQDELLENIKEVQIYSRRHHSNVPPTDCNARSVSSIIIFK